MVVSCIISPSERVTEQGLGHMRTLGQVRSSSTSIHGCSCVYVHTRMQLPLCITSISSSTSIHGCSCTRITCSCSCRVVVVVTDGFSCMVMNELLFLLKRNLDHPSLACTVPVSELHRRLLSCDIYTKTLVVHESLSKSRFYLGDAFVQTARAHREVLLVQLLGGSVAQLQIVRATGRAQVLLREILQRVEIATWECECESVDDISKLQCSAIVLTTYRNSRTRGV